MIDLEFYSPIQQIQNQFLEEKKVALFIKRDDLIHPFISGNKWRKLKYTLRRARLEQKNHLVTFGGAYSNHLLATACAAARFGFQSTGFVRGEPVQNDTLLFCRLFGMKLIFTSRESYHDKEALFDENFHNNLGAFFIAEGGASGDAIKGCAELIDELDQKYDHIFCASGTGTTVAGIISGVKNSALETNVHSVSVFKDGNFLRNDISKHFDSDVNFELHLDYHFGGYAKTKPPLLKFIQTFASSTGILLDPVYTGKMFYGIYDLIQKNYFQQNTKILAVHTGGLFGILGMSEKFQQII